MEESSKSKFETMGTSAARGFRNASAEGTGKAKLVKKKGADPYKQAKPARANKKASGKATYGGVKVSMPAYTAPEAGLTQANGRLFSAAVRRTAPNFKEGISSQS
jgi:hypothetical protein